MNKEIEVVLQLLRVALNQKSFVLEINDISWEKVEKILVNNRMMNMAYFGLLKMKDTSMIPIQLQDKMKAEYDLSIVKEAHQHFALEEIKEEFEKRKIAFLPLKGSILKEYYPYPQMRMMGDIDILHQFNQKEDVNKTLLSLGYNQIMDAKITHDIYQRTPFIRIEMHKELISKNMIQREYFNDIWKRVRLNEGKKFEYEMTWEDYYLFLLAHMAKHFSNSGTGLRSLTDFHVFIQNKGNDLNRSYVDEKLKKIQLDKFEKQLFEIDDCIFNDKEWVDQDLLKVFEYMVSSGIYGNFKNSSLNNMSKTSSNLGGKILYLKDLIFINCESAEIFYPWLKRRRYLLGFAWILRITDRMIHKKDKLKDVVTYMKNEDEIIQMKKIQEIVGLQNNH